MYHRYLSADETLDLFQKHLAEHVENLKDAFECEVPSDHDLEAACLHLSEAISLRDNVRDLRGLLIWADEQKAKRKAEARGEA